MIDNHRGDWMQTASGRAYYPGAPLAGDVNIDDIAQALSKLCRFGGHCKRFYSVAEHSVLVSQVVPERYALQALLHDATEAYVVDLPRPLKHQLPAYMDIEARNWSVIAEHFNLPYDLHPTVKAADDAVLLAEKAALLGDSPMPWNVPGEPADVFIQGLAPRAAYWEFMNRYFALTGELV